MTIQTLNWQLQSPQERLECVNQVLAETPNPSSSYLDLMATYLTDGALKGTILTDNRKQTIEKRETSLEAINADLYLQQKNDKNAIFRPKVSITKKDLEEIPFLQDKRESISFWEKQLTTATPHNAYVIKNLIIELRKDQYLIKEAYRKPLHANPLLHCTQIFPLTFPSSHYLGLDDTVRYSGLSFCDPRIVSLILLSYQTLSQKDSLMDDTWYLLEDFRRLYRSAMSPHPLYHRLVQLKINGVSNLEIQDTILSEYNVYHTVEYYSSLWRHKIPAIIAEEAIRQYLVWYHTNVVYSTWKRCSRCGAIKLAHNVFFSINKSTKSGFYSLCKECRRKKVKWQHSK